MKRPDIKQSIGWLTIIISLAVSSFWTYWGIIEFFHEGWYAPSVFNKVFVLFVQYLSPAIIFTALALISLSYKKVGLIIYCLVGVFSAYFFSGASFQVVYLSLALPIIVLGLLFYYSDFVDKKKVSWIFIVWPLIIVLIAGALLLIRNLRRVDDGNYSQRIIDCQGEKIVWAQHGLGFPDAGANWEEAITACEHLSADGSEIQAQAVNIWRLPSIDEAIRCQMQHDRNAGGYWNEISRQASYDRMPDKETPLWQPDSEIIYYWTRELSRESEGQAYIFTYDGGIYDKDIRFAPNTQSFRCVKNFQESDYAQFGTSTPVYKAIESYLLTQKEFFWQTEEDSQRACLVEDLGSEGGLFPLSLWVYCQEYRIENGEIRELSGSSGPALVDYPNELSYFDLARFSHRIPRDGSAYYKDIEEIFPKAVQNKIFTYRGQNNLHKVLNQRILGEGIYLE